MKQVVIYGVPPSAYVRIVRMVCEEKRVLSLRPDSDDAPRRFRPLRGYGRRPLVRGDRRAATAPSFSQQNAA